MAAIGMLGSRMPSTDAAIREIARVLRQHVDQNTRQRIVEDLLDTRGDKTFRDTIEQLAHDLNVKV